MKQKTRFLSMVLAVLMMAGVLPLSVLAADGYSITPSASGALYNPATNTLTVSGGTTVTFTTTAPADQNAISEVVGYRQANAYEGDADSQYNELNAPKVSDNTFSVVMPNMDATYFFGGYYTNPVGDSTKTDAVYCTVVVQSTALTEIPVNGTSLPIQYRDETVYLEDTASQPVKVIDVSGLSGATGVVFAKARLTFDPDALIVRWLSSGYLPYEIATELKWYSDSELQKLLSALVKYVFEIDHSELQNLIQSELDRRAADTEKVDSALAVKFDGTELEMDRWALDSLLDQLKDGDRLKITEKPVYMGKASAYTELTDDDVVCQDILFKVSHSLNLAYGSNEQLLRSLGVLGDADEVITWGEWKYLYHKCAEEVPIYKLRSLVSVQSTTNQSMDSLFSVSPSYLLSWLDERIAREEIPLPLTNDQLTELGLSALNNGVGTISIRTLRAANLTLDQLCKIKETISAERDANAGNQALVEKCNHILAWADEAIAMYTWTPKKPQTVIGAVEVDFETVKGTVATPIKAKGELAYTISNIRYSLSADEWFRAFRVGEDGSLEEKECTVTGLIGALSITVYSDTNSYYIFTVEPAASSAPLQPESKPTFDPSTMQMLLILLTQTRDITATATAGGFISPPGVTTVRFDRFQL